MSQNFRTFAMNFWDGEVAERLGDTGADDSAKVYYVSSTLTLSAKLAITVLF